MNSNDGSYQFDQFSSDIQSQEIERLNDRSSVLQQLERRIWQNIGLTSTMTVLDLGCGTGRMTEEIAQLVTDGQVIGVDRSPTMIAEALKRDRVSKMSNLTFQVGNSDNLDFPDESFDFVYVRLLFQHLNQPLLTLQEIKRVLKPGGIICIVDVDDHWTMFYPLTDSIATFQKEFVKIQQLEGGDPYVGRKLGSYLSETGFIRVNTAIEIINSDLLENFHTKGSGLNSFLDLLSFGAAFYDRYPEIIPLAVKAKSDAYQMLELSYAWAGFGLFVVTGLKSLG